MPRFLFSLLVIVVLTVLLAIMLVRTGPESRATLQPLPPQRVVTTEVRSVDFQPITRITGQLQPVRQTHRHFEVSGQLIERRVEPGQKVAAGELLLQLDSGDYADAVAAAEAALAQEREARARDRRLLDLIEEQVRLQEAEVSRMEQLGQRSLASKSNYDTAMQSLLQLQAEAERLRHSQGCCPPATARG